MSVVGVSVVGGCDCSRRVCGGWCVCSWCDSGGWV